MLGITFGEARRQKHELSVYSLALIFILGLFDKLSGEVLAGLIATVFITAVGGNVGSKIATVLPSLFAAFRKKDETTSDTI